MNEINETPQEIVLSYLGTTGAMTKGYISLNMFFGGYLISEAALDVILRQLIDDELIIMTVDGRYARLGYVMPSKGDE